MLKPRITPHLKCLVLSGFTAILLLLLTGNSHSQIPKLNSFPESTTTVYLDFDGQTIKGTAWNWDGDIVAKPADLSNEAITIIHSRVAEDFRIFNINVTTDPAKFASAPALKRVRLILTPTYEWYGSSGGVAFVNSFSWGDDTPAFVFTKLLHNDIKYVAEAASHEIGHTLGLQHQSQYNKTCDLVAEYAEGRGDGEIGWAPIMGVGYYKNFTTWTFGTSIEDCKKMQNDIAIILNSTNRIKLRTDDFANARNNAAWLSVVNNRFEQPGVINSSTDKDYFKIAVHKKSKIQVTVAPYNVGALNEGANADLMVTLINNNGDTVLSANPKQFLSAAFDTSILAGTYYIAVDGVGNQNVSDYGSLGFYTLTGTVSAATVIKPVVISGNVRRNIHLLNWDNSDLQESGVKMYLETSMDGVRYIPLSSNPVKLNSYMHEASGKGMAWYRLRVVLPDESDYFSNSVLLTTSSVSLLNSIVTNSVRLNAASEYSYQLFDGTGRMLQRGKIIKGLNSIRINTATQGLLIMKVFNDQQQMNFRLMRR